MKAVICGSRSIKDFKVVNEYLSLLKQQGLEISEIVSGCAIGPDKLGETWAAANGVNISRWPAEWKKYGISAGFIRNKQMAEYCDIVIAFWDGKSKGTKHMIDYAKSLNKKVFVKNVTISCE